MTLINYEITDNWVESIRVYIFTEEHMFYADQYLNEDCQKVGEVRFLPSVDKGNYLNERRGSNVSWGDNPGITYDTQERVMEMPTREEVPNNGDLIRAVERSGIYD